MKTDVGFCAGEDGLGCFGAGQQGRLDHTVFLLLELRESVQVIGIGIHGKKFVEACFSDVVNA